MPTKARIKGLEEAKEPQLLMLEYLKWRLEEKNVIIVADD